MIADDTSVALFGPVILADGANQALPHAASTTTADDRAVIGVCVRLNRSGTLTADVSHIEVCIHGICKVKVNDATVNLNDALSTNSTAGEAKVRAAFVISAAYSETEVQNALQGIRSTFGIALSTVTSGADSIVAAFINIVPNAGAS
jgi:hypothetical protein